MKTFADGRLVWRYLKKDAVPSICPNAPSYLSNTVGTPWSTKKASVASCREQQRRELEDLAETFMAEDSISHLDLNDLTDKLRAETIPEGFTVVPVSQLCLLISVLDVSTDIPKIRASISVNSDLFVVVSVEDKLVPACHLKNLVDGSLMQISQLVARVKSWCRELGMMSLEMSVQMAI